MSLAAGFRSTWDTLGAIGRDPVTGGYTRLVWSDTERTLREWFTAEARARALDVHEDRAGNLWAWWGDPTAGDAVVTGSHLDAVPAGGAFDGPLGVVSGLLAVDELRARAVAPSRPLALVAFSDEEGGRYGIACAGSRLLTGQLDPARALALTDDDGRTQAEAVRASGRDPDHLGADPDVLARIGVFVELHVEQGRGLVELDAPVGVATAIRAHGRWRFDLDGRPDHAGTTRLEDRQDPMLAQARLVLATRDAAARHGALATVGKVRVHPGAVNAIPGRVQVWVDARADEEVDVRAVIGELERTAGTTGREESGPPRGQREAARRDRRATSAGGRGGGGPVRALATGAGHDAGVLATAGVPTAMLFVRNPTGISHAPDEHAEEADCLTGVAALTDVLAELVAS
ncbi:MAG: allantoate amidohydrolase [Nitriliruptoraceae bacterium]|nr:allantoate amidohydrolase [Nitriliruptoraceae bacterium]